jgi:hypothetical protein
MPIQSHQNIVKNAGIASSEQAEIAMLAFEVIPKLTSII